MLLVLIIFLWQILVYHFKKFFILLLFSNFNYTDMDILILSPREINGCKGIIYFEFGFQDHWNQVD